MLGRLSFVAFSALLVVACSESGPPTTLSFKPEDGEQRRYQLYSDTNIKVESSYGKRSERLKTMMLLDYEVSDKSDVYSISMKPQFMRMEFPQGDFTSFEDDNRGSSGDSIRKMMDAGFTVDIDKDTSAMVDFIIHEEPENFGKQGLDPLQEILNDEFGRPGFITGLKVEKGATQLVELKSPLPEMTFKVEDFTNSTVTLSATGDNNEARVFGYVILDRATGWTERLTMIMDMPLPEELPVSNGSMRMVTSMFPEDWLYGQDLEHLRYLEPFEIDNTDFSELNPNDRASDAEVFANNAGQLELYSGRVSMRYIHPGVSFEQMGSMSIKVKELTAKDHDGNPLDIDLYESAIFTYADINNEKTETTIHALPLGWTDVVDNLGQMTSIEATLERYETSYEIVDFPIGKEGSSINMEGAEAILVPTEDDNVFELTLTSTNDAYFDSQVNGVSGAVLSTFSKDESSPQWVSDAESRALAITRSGRYSVKMQLTFENELPETIELKFNHVTDNKISEKKVIFYDEETLRSDTTIAPVDTVPLFKSDEMEFSINDQELKFSMSALDELEPTSFDRPQLYLTLSPEQAAVCKLNAKARSEGNKSELVMRENADPNRRNVVSHLKMPKKVVYQLMTDDGVQRFIYDTDIALKLRCDGQPEWQSVDIALGEKSWMIPVESLLGEDWEEQHAEVAMSEFLRKYRFLNVNGKALAVLPQNDEGYSVDYLNTEFSDFVSDDGFLRIGGRVEKVEQLIAKGAPVKKEWIHQLPPMPDFESLQEAN
ncbi:hypothetical protein U0358_08265 [Idiomarina sp. PL1-037]|uniref:hypothetical protein n=1 Tax=Idiomarina sp. PL1-037 TaxID=3095365 RepID=UPI002ACC38C4|nr:hypothetical protein [Idiomarina sp. PL1-037]WQC52053.1 hypothetical protein U0358_08265 [Idiomarina sp. PL1-037]